MTAATIEAGSAIPDNPVGFHADIPEAEYHAHQGSLSFSGAKTLLKSPALYQWQRQNPVHKDIFDVGSAAHHLVLGIGEEIVVVEADDWRTKAAQEAKAKARAENKIPVLAKTYIKVVEMAEVLSSHTRAMELLSAGTPEVSAFAVDEETGVLRRCRFDWFSDTLVDYKSADSAHPDAFARAAANLRYFQQDPYYSDIAADLGHANDGFEFIVQEKEPPYLVSVLRLDADARRRGREENRRALSLFDECTQSGEWPGYGPNDRTQTIRLPKWAYYDNQAVTE